MDTKNYTDIKMSINLEDVNLDKLEKVFDTYCEAKDYFIDKGEWETKAQQLCIALSKLCYKFWNDWDRYIGEMGWNDMSTYANWINNNCFSIPKCVDMYSVTDEDYENVLKSIIIQALSVIDDYKDTPKVWSIYTEQWYFKHGRTTWDRDGEYDEDDEDDDF